ncbi:MAG TPA: hypothetical protein VGI43_18620 [Mucilaginibacter sp.]|jgi:tetratricopeptide (TPR) repeat protein
MDRYNPTHLIEQATELYQNGEIHKSMELLQKGTEIFPDWPAPYYNLGIVYKGQRNWEQSYMAFEQVLKLDNKDIYSWWHFGIASTALKNWKSARRAWVAIGFEIEINDEELILNLDSSPIRINPDSNPEVVWCDRIDPARAVICNIPFPGSGHRFGDIILNDNVHEGLKESDGIEYPILNEIQLLVKSKYSTCSTYLYTGNQQHYDSLEELCDAAGVKIENWPSQLRKRRKSNVKQIYVGFAALKKELLIAVLANWKTITSCEHSELTIELE